MNNSNSPHCRNGLGSSQEGNVAEVGIVHPSMEHFGRKREMKQNDNCAFSFAITKGGKEESRRFVNGETIQNGILPNGKYEPKSSLIIEKLSENEMNANKNCQNGSITKEHPTASIINGEHAQNGSHSGIKQAQNGTIANNAHAQNGTDETNTDTTEELSVSYSSNKTTLNVNGSCNGQMSKTYEHSCSHERAKIGDPLLASRLISAKRQESSVVITEKLTAAVLKDLFEDQICVLHIPNYVPQMVCDKLDRFLRDRGSDQYTHEIRKDGRADLLYFGVNRYGFPLNSTYNDNTGKSMERYFSEALPTMQSIRNAAAPYLSPIDKLRVELDETWSRKVNVATLNGRKTFCGIGRIMPASLSELSADQPHFDAVPTTYFPDIHKQFAANVYLNVPEEGGELEIWNVPPVDVENVENFTIPENWRSRLPQSIKVKPGAGDLLLLNTRRPHAITKFVGDKPRTSIQSFIGLTKESDVFLWV